MEGLEKKISCPFWEMDHNSLNSINCVYTEPVFYHCGTTATLSHTGVCHGSRGVLDSHEKKSLHCSDNSNGVNAEHC